jgi:hypothetical protein
MAKEKAETKKGGKKAETKAAEKPATEGLIREALEAAAKDLVAVMQLVKTPLNGDLAELDDDALKAAIVDAADAEGVSGLVGDGNLKAVQKADHAVEGIDTVAAGTKAVLIALDCDPGVGVREEKGKASKAKAEKPAAEKKGKEKAAKAPKEKKEGSKRPGFHGAGGEGKPGVIASIREFLKASGKKGITKEEILTKLTDRFPDRAADSMKATINVQLPGRIGGDEFKVEKNGDKYHVA